MSGLAVVANANGPFEDLIFSEYSEVRGNEYLR